jgi:hypothetical protein
MRSRIPAKAKTGLEIVEITAGPRLKAEHGIPAVGGLDGIIDGI